MGVPCLSAQFCGDVGAPVFSALRIPIDKETQRILETTSKEA